MDLRRWDGGNGRLPRQWVAGRRLLLALLLALVALGGTLHQLRSQDGQATDQSTLGYGFNVTVWDVARLEGMGFDWIKVFNPPGYRLPLNVLLRVEANAQQYQDLAAFGAAMGQLAQGQAGYIDAYEIGNEPNLDAAYGWTAPPDAAAYAALLCTAYSHIKAADPQAKVISAGLAPTGRVQGNWNGHPGHNGLYQDEREFLKEFLAAGGGDCLDGLGYHPYGFSADYDAAPDVAAADPDQNCTNGFCFRGTEKIHELMVQYGYGHRPLWATEFGWLVTPPDHCRADGSWDGRLWQLVSEAEQADNLVGAYQYAAAHWPWMEAMFVFNLNFNLPGWYQECEQMRYYAVQGRLAEAALREMPKETPPPPPPPVRAVQVTPAQIGALITPTQQPMTIERLIRIENVGTVAVTVTAQAAPGMALTPTLTPTLQMVLPGERAVVAVAVASGIRPLGLYTGTITISATEEVTGAPASIPVRLVVAEQIVTSYLPHVAR